MKRLFWILITGLASGCDKSPSGNAGAPSVPSPAPAAASGPRALGAETGSFFWFNSRTISDAGQAHYGRFAYTQLLPFLSPGEQKNLEAWFVVQDGDYLGAMNAPASGPEERRILDEVDRIGRSLCYAIAVFGSAGLSLEDIDSRLRSGKVTGYLGRTTAPGTDAQKFV
ncbi:MAG TPA: hypothetical protein VKU80_13140, partial [Planctomycetota bacterium]|nr:hypothetical protein [Planctomycetota bacterium]